MKALSVQQPWAHLISIGVKPYEVRSRRTHYRGPLLVCASLRHSTHPNAKARQYKIGPRGFAVCTVELVDCIPGRPDLDELACVPTEGMWCWVLRDPQPVAQLFPVKGRLGLFEVELPGGAT